MITKNKGNEKFFKFTEETAKLLRDANLSKNARTLWDYIVTTNPFGDEEITATEILTELNWKEHTYYRAKKELEKAGLVQTKKHRCTLISTLKTRLTKAVSTVTKTVKELNKNCQTTDKNRKNIDENCQNEPLKALSINDSGLPQTIQTISDLSDLSEEKDKNNTSNIQEDRLMDEGEIDGLTDNKLIDHQEEPFTTCTERSRSVAPCPSTFKDENTVPRSPFPVPSQEDERLKNEEFIRYAQGKLPKARDIKRYLLTNDKTTGDRILERIWLEYQQWKSGKTNTPNSTGSEYFDNLIEEYKALRGEPMAWEKVNWSDKLPCYDLWLNKAQNSRYGNTFIDDNSLGYTRNLRAVFFRWYEQFGSKQQLIGSDKKIPENPQGIGLINAFKHIMGGGVNYAY